MPFWCWHSIALRIVALVNSDKAPGQVVSATFANQGLVLIEAVYDDGRQFVNVVCLIDEVEGLIEDWVQIVIDCFCLLRLV